ncbi:uncharacterized protein LOC126903053 [Daktulosphaira vitifoliae]|uniref:uncharacterized protein LOC126903053 n=1 Tax=Daktulosphaira vitifoliae TaxID=58002 RepID=UPI0021A9E7C5|nr:uncharacterized protein LOC126903053 [Daktulosphaira vitifoliae]
MASKWREFVITLLATGSIEMRSVEDEVIIKQWAEAFEKNNRITFIGISTITNGYTGVRFINEDCLTHIVESKEFSVYLPIRFQSNVGLSRIENKIDFYFRHNGTTRLALIQQQLNKGYLIEIENRVITLLWRSMGKKPKLLESNTFNVNIIKEHSWSHIGLSWDENTLWINCSEGLQMWTLSGKSAPLLVRYFSVANRGGQTTWTVNCNPPDIDGTPRNGGWSDWGEWEQCSKTCGTGMGIRYRQCDNPKPNMFGEPCVGPTEFPGKCNEHECGQLSKKTIKNIQDRIRQKTYNLHAVEGEKLILVCNKNSVNAVKVDLVNPTFDWIKNGKLLEKGGKNVENDGCKLVIHKCTKSDSGVYAYIVQPLNRQKVILKIIAVTIMESPTYAYIGDIIQVQCNAITLGYLFKDLSQQWVLNDTFVIKNYGITSLAIVDIDKIVIESMNFQGKWTCVVKHSAMNSTWITEAKFVKVLGQSTRWTRIMQDPLIRTIFWKVNSPIIISRLCIILIVVVFICTWGGAVMFHRWQKQLTILPKKNQNYQQLKI